MELLVGGKDSLREAVLKLEQGDGTYLHIAYCAFALGDGELARQSGRSVRRFLEAYNMQGMIRLSETFRQYTSMEWVIDWERIDPGRLKNKLDSEKDYIYMLILGSFHPNGYYRERCVWEMADYPGTLPFLILRMNDWVEPIRAAAEKTVCRRVQCCEVHELFCAAQALSKVHGSGRRSGEQQARVDQLIKQRMEREADGISAEAVLGYDCEVRRYLYHFLLSGRILDYAKAEELLERERSGSCQTLIISELLKYYSCSLEQTGRYLRHKNACVRKKAMDYKYSVLKGAWPGLEEMLLDSSRSVRGMAAFILNRQGTFDVQAFYISHLQDDNPAAAVTGLGEVGRRETAECLKPFLTHASEKVVRSAVTAVGRLEGIEGADIFWEYLFDPRVSVSRASFRAAADNGVKYGAEALYEALSCSGAPHLKRYLLYLLLRENSWDSLPYLVRIWQKPDLEEYRNKILASLRSRNMYTFVPPAKAALIRQALEQEGRELPEPVRRGILFDLKFVEKR